MSPFAVIPLDRPPNASVEVPGSKSVTNRALLIGALADGRSTVRGPLIADDTEAMSDVAVALGAKVSWGDGRVEIVGTGGTIPSSGRVFARRSGTTARFVAPVLGLARGPWTLDGDAQLAARPMEDLYRALESLGVTVERLDATRSLPVAISGPIDRTVVAVSGSTTSQFLSGVLLAAPLTPSGMTVEIAGELKSSPYVGLTVDTMRHFGANVEIDGSRFHVTPGGYVGGEIVVEPDASTASYFFAAAAITGGRVLVEGLTRESHQGDVAFVDILERMGASYEATSAGIAVVGSGTLVGIEIDASDTPDLVPTIAVVAALAQTRSVISGVGFTRGHESDRVGGLVAALHACGIDTTEEPDGLVIEPSVAHGGLVVTSSDHRMAMAFAILGLVVPGVELDDPGCVEKTFPEFFEVLERLRA